MDFHKDGYLATSGADKEIKVRPHATGRDASDDMIATLLQAVLSWASGYPLENPGIES